MAKVRKRIWGDGKSAWIADYFDQNGKRHIKTFKTQKAAKAWLVGTGYEVKQGTHTPESDSITVAEAADIWIKRGKLEGLERSTLAQYENHVELHIKPSRIGREKLARLSTPMIEAFRDDLLRACKSRATARKILTSLKGILGEAQRRGLVAQNVAQPVKVTINRRDRRRLDIGRDIPSKEEISMMLAKVSDHWRPLVVTAVFTGMRASELRGLTWDDVDFTRRVIHVRQRANWWGEIGAPKSAAGHREIPMSPMVVNTLKEWKLRSLRGEAGFVFPNPAGRVQSHNNLSYNGIRALQMNCRIVDDRGEAKYGPHALRHFFASWAIEQGFSPKKLQALMGHSSITLTYDRYGHLFPSLDDDHAKFAAGEISLLG
jgi:integrase